MSPAASSDHSSINQPLSFPHHLNVDEIHQSNKPMKLFNNVPIRNPNFICVGYNGAHFVPCAPCNDNHKIFIRLFYPSMKPSMHPEEPLGLKLIYVPWLQKGTKQLLVSPKASRASSRKMVLITSKALPDEEKVVSSTRALSLSKIPKTAVVIGASYIGLEVGSVWARLGSKVTVVDPAPVIVPSMDGGIRKKFQSILVKQKLKFMLETEVIEVDTSSSSAVKLTIQPTSGGQKSMIETDVVLAPEYSVPNTAGLGLEMVGVKIDVNTGGIKIDERFMTSMPHVYAIGDVATPRPMLAAHKAATDAAECVRIISGKEDILSDLDKVPGVMYTHPEVASIGMAEEQAKATGVSYRTFKSKMLDDDGTVKIVEDKVTKKVVGVHLLSPIAGAKIGDAAQVLKDNDGDARDFVVRMNQVNPEYKRAASSWMLYA